MYKTKTFYGYNEMVSFLNEHHIDKLDIVHIAYYFKGLMLVYYEEE